MRPAGRAALMLSGGLDSAALAAAAVEAARRHSLPVPLLLSARYAGLACDETAYQDVVARHVGGPWVSVNATDIPLWPAAEEAYMRAGTPIVDGQEGINRALYAMARREGCSIILYGVGADELFQGIGLETDFIRGGRWADAWSLLSSLRELRGLSWSEVILRRGLRTALRRSPHGITIKEGKAAGSWARAVLRRSFASTTPGWRYELADRTAMAEGVRLGMPFFGAGVIETVTGAPSARLMMGGRLKGMLREAVRPHLPAVIVDRVRKANFQAYFRHRSRLEATVLAERYAALKPFCPSDLAPPIDPFTPLGERFGERAFLTAWFWLGIFAFIQHWPGSPRGSDLDVTRAS
jgi:asparagine synthase (glutamine-hydrolysing)